MPLTLPRGKPSPIWLAVLLWLAGALNPLHAQLIANFTPNRTGGCSPLAVIFQNTTTGAGPGAIYSWNFGNGNSITTTDGTLPVAATYSIGQVYTVTLSVQYGGQTSTKSININVYKPPVVNFQGTNTLGCQPLTSSFSSSSTPGDGFITSYFWDFGDGITLNTTSSNVNHIYNFTGIFTVGLTVTNSDGCTSTFQRVNIVQVLPGVIPAFTADSTMLCNISDPVLFQNNSTGPGPLSYSWDFGDGASSNSPNPSHQYAAKGTYTVQLTVTNPQGCIATIVKPAYVNAANFNLDFSNTPTACTGSGTSFIDLSTPAPTGSSKWDFGDGQTGTGSPVNHAYSSTGNFVVTLTDQFGLCQVSLQKNINVFASPVTAGFMYNKGAACSSPMLVSFTDTTSTAVKWLWHFTGNPADTSTLQDPTFLYANNNLYNPTLTVTDSNGCSTTVSEPLNSAAPTATIKMDTTLTPSPSICADVNATFTAISQDTLVTWLWDFGDGTTSTSPNPTHTYSVPGTYIINLSFVTNHGCSGVAFPPDTVRVYPKPHSLFTALDSIPCGRNLTELFTNLDDSAAQFLWFYGDGTSDINNNVYHIHQYQFTGNATMTLIASSPGCKPDTSTITRYLVTTPVPYITSTNTCDSTRMTVVFNDSTAGGWKYVWDYGDGTMDSSNSFIPQKIHDYAQPGAYTVTLTGYFDSCVAVSNPLQVYTLRPQHPLLSSTLTTVCESGTLPVQISGLDTNWQAVANGNGSYYNIVNWQYNDGTTFGPQGNTGFKTSYNGNLTNLKPGEDSIRVIVRSRFFNCYDTSNFIPVHISGPVAGFTALDHLCYPAPVIFTDTSKMTDSIPIVKWVWDFGDSTVITRTTNDTVMHQYAFPGNYPATLTVTDSNGCSATATLAFNYVVVNGPKADFYWNPAATQLGSPITFFNSTTTGGAGATYKWHFSSDGFTSTAPVSLVRTYMTPTVDTVRLIATGTGPGGCVDTAIQVVIVPKTTARFTYTTSYINKANCPPMVAYFISYTNNADSLHWDFGDGSTAENNPIPSHTYTTPGVYLVTLTAFGPGGNSDSYQDSVTVKGPFAVLHADVLQACIPALETLHATTSLVASYIWDYGDGTVLGTSDTISTHTYIIPGVFTPHLVITDSTGCQVNFDLGQTILMDSLHVKIGPDTTMCNPGTVLFTPQIYSMAQDSLNEVLTTHWDFGTGQPGDTSSAYNPQFTFPAPGVYVVSLNTQSPPGCNVTALDTVRIASPFTLQYVDTAHICPGGSATLSVTGGNTYNWVPDPTLGNINGGTAVARPSTTTTYTVIGHDKYFCFTDTANLTVKLDSVPTVSVDPVITIPGGSSTVLNTMVSPDVVSWSWYPSSWLSCTDCSAPTSLPNAPISYIVTVTNASGCKSSDTVTIRLTCSTNAVHMPNAFTPNGDGNNDEFYPMGAGIKIIKTFQVYSRWGELLYSRTDIPANDKTYGWNGTLNGTKQPSGTYVYMVVAECFTGEDFLLKGTLELLR